MNSNPHPRSEKFFPTSAHGWVALVASMLLKVTGLTVSFFASAWIATRLHLAVLATAPNQMLRSAGILSPADVPRAMESVGPTFVSIAPIAGFCFSVALILVRVLEWRRQGSSVIRVVSGGLCAGIAVVALVVAVIGFYEPITLAGLVAGALTAFLVGAFGMSPAFGRSIPR